MSRRQTMPQQWLIIADRPDWLALRRLPMDSGVLVLGKLTPAEMLTLRKLSRARRHQFVQENPRTAARVHNMHEVRSALLRRAPLLLVSPIHSTGSHPDWRPLPRMRAAVFARLTGRQAIALGGMNRQRYAKIAPLGFIGWAGISAFRT